MNERALLKASKNGSIEFLEGSDVNVTNEDDYSPLHLAAIGGHLEVVKLLLARGAEVGAVNTSGVTPLHEAAYGGHQEVVRLLLAAGAQAGAVDKV